MKLMGCESSSVPVNDVSGYGETICRGLQQFMKDEIELTHTVTESSTTGTKITITPVNRNPPIEESHTTSLTDCETTFTFTFTGDALHIETDVTNWEHVTVSNHVGEAILCIIESEMN